MYAPVSIKLKTPIGYIVGSQDTHVFTPLFFATTNALSLSKSVPAFGSPRGGEVGATVYPVCVIPNQSSLSSRSKSRIASAPFLVSICTWFPASLSSLIISRVAVLSYPLGYGSQVKHR